MDDELFNLEIDQEGVRPIITKRAQGDNCARLVHEAAMLRAARHPGVVSLVDSENDDDCQLQMYFVGSRTLAGLGRVEPKRAAALVAAMAATVADLHELGIAHSRLSADHVIVAADGRPVLCGFGEAYFISSVVEGASDVAALGRLLYDLVSTNEATFEFPERPSRKASSRATLRAPLLNLAEQAMESDPRRRPTARQFSDLIQDTVPDASLVGDSSSSRGGLAANNLTEPQPWSGLTSVSRGFVGDGASGGAIVAIVAGALCLFIAGGAWFLRADSGSDPELANQALDNAAVSPADEATVTAPNQTIPEYSPSDSSTATVPTVPTDSASTAEAKEAGEEPATSNLLIDLAKGCSVSPDSTAVGPNGTDCAVDLRFTGTILAINDEAFDFGEDDLAVAIGDFACNNHVRPAVANRGSGFVYLFDSWATPNTEVSALVVGQVDGLRQLLAEPGPGECNQLIALDNWGIRHTFSLPGDLATTTNPPNPGDPTKPEGA